MVRILASHPGGYPRPPDLRKTIDSYNAGKANFITLHRVWRTNMQKVIMEQTEEGLDVLTTGHLLWDDIFRPFNKVWEGIEIPEVGNYYRFYELNFYYKRAKVKGPIVPKRPAVLHEHEMASKIVPRLLKASIPGPLTFALHVEDDYYNDMDALMSDISKALAYEASYLAPLVDYIQIEEPALVDPEVKPELKEMAIEYINLMVQGLTIPVIVKTYFKPAEEIYELLLDLDADGIGIDLTVWNSDEVKATLSENGYPFKIIDFGVTDALNVKLEPIEESASKLYSIMDEINVEEVHVSANYRYDVLPYSYIRKKMRRLAEITFKLRELVEEG